MEVPARVINNYRERIGKVLIVRTAIATKLLLGGGIMFANYVNIKNNKDYIKVGTESVEIDGIIYDKRDIIQTNLTGWCVLKGLLYGSFPLLSISHMCYNATFNSASFYKHVVPGSRHMNFDHLREN